MNERRTRNEDSINLMDMLRYVLKYYKLIMLTTVIGLIIGIIVCVISFLRGEMSKQYAIKTSIAVTSQTSDGLFTSQSRNPNSTDIHLAEDMVDSVIFVIRSDRTLEKAVDELELIGITPKDIYDNLQLTQYNDTQIIDISLYWRNAEEGIRILEAINKVAPKILVDILKIGDVRVVNDPTSKYLIGGSLKVSTWIMFTFLGCAAGGGIAILMMLFRPTLLNVNDAKNKLGLNLLGVIPKEKHYKTTHIQDGVSTVSQKMADSYKSTTSILLKAAEKEDCRIIYCTSTEEGEGTTSVAANLGLQLANFEKKILLIDMDFITPNLATKFVEKVDHVHSLNGLYDGEVSIDDAILSVNGYLDILPMVHDDREIIINETMLSMIKEKSKEYDYTIIDTAAVGKAADVLRINTIADGVVYVIQYDSATLKTIAEAISRLHKTEIPILGCIVNQSTFWA